MDPGLLSLQTGHGNDPRLTAGAALHHALEHFEGVEAVDVETGETDGDRFLQRRLQFVLQKGITPGDGQ